MIWLKDLHIIQQVLQYGEFAAIACIFSFRRFLIFLIPCGIIVRFHAGLNKHAKNKST